MLHLRRPGMLAAFAMLIGLGSFSARAQEDRSQIKTVFVIAMENHNWTQPANQFTGGIQQIFQNPNAPYINSLVNGTSAISSQVSYAVNYHNVLATPSGNNPHIHPSEPNYIWAEAGGNFGVLNDNDPFAASGPTNQNIALSLSNLLTQNGRTWRSYQEDTDLETLNGQLINVALPRNQWTVPLVSISGIFGGGTFNQFNGSSQFNYAAKHNPQVFFTFTNGGNDVSTANPLSHHYAPLQQLFEDLEHSNVAEYNWITPNQFNDMHTTLTGGYQGLTGDAAKIKQGDDFLKQIIPVIVASPAYKDHGAIIIWFDETERDGAANDNADDFNHTLGEIVISPLAHRNDHGLPYASLVNLTHSSDLRTMQEIFCVGPLLGDAVNADDLSDLFARGAIPDADDCVRHDQDRDHD